MGIAALEYLTRSIPELAADPLGLPIGCQTWPVRQSIGKDLDGTLHRLSAAGFQNIELCSPPSYKDSGFGSLAALKPSELQQRIHAAGLRCESCHYNFTELKQHMDDRMAYAKELGLKQMIISTFALRKEAKIADWMRAADDANKLGGHARDAGIQLGFHNHDFEFQKLDGELIYDKLMGELDPQLVKMQFQVAVVRLGYNAADFFEKYPGRFISMHLQDWSPSLNKEVPLGQGMVDWKRVFAAAKTGGIRNYFVEMDPPALAASVPYLHKLS
ncbi:MAG: sugar phosphate isomerase/epimerase family protein [Bryobacteraceae bacterium]